MMPGRVNSLTVDSLTNLTFGEILLDMSIELMIYLYLVLGDKWWLFRLYILLLRL